MIPMPYILVNIVLDELSLLFFCITTAALLSKWPLANLWLPVPMKNRKTLAFVAHALVLIVIVRVMARWWRGFLFSPFISDILTCIGLINSVVLAYRFLDKRYFLNMPKVQRRFLLAIFSLVMTFVPFLAVVTAMVGLFVIK